MKALIWIGIIAGSIIGAYLPVLIGFSSFSFVSILGSGIGGIIGLAAGYKLAQHLDLP
jgi:hypothetical protein